jgi:hypothetical protein
MTSLIAEAMNSLIKLLTKSGLLAKGLDYHLLRASMVIDVRRTPVPWFLGQEAGNSRSDRIDDHVRGDGQYYSIHAEQMGSGGRISRNGRQRSLPRERRGPFGGINLFAEAGCRESVA